MLTSSKDLGVGLLLHLKKSCQGKTIEGIDQSTWQNVVLMRILITGVAGFVGSNLALRLKEWHPDWELCGIDNLRRRGGEFNLPRLRQAGVNFFHGDIRCPDDFPRGDIDILIDCAAEPSVLAGYGGDSPRYVIDANLVGLLNCLELARERRSKLFFLSTSRVYPIQPLNDLAFREDETRYALEAAQSLPGASEWGIAEDFPLMGQRSIYGATKLCGELLIQEYAAAYQLDSTITRFGVIAGPWQMGKVDQGVFSLWVGAHLWQRPLTYCGWGGAGKQLRDVLHVDDLCELVDFQLREPQLFVGKIFNAGGGLERSLSLCETTELCAELTGNRVPIASQLENRPADLRIFVTDSRRIETATGWSPRRSAKQTCEDLCRWMRDHQDLLANVF